MIQWNTTFKRILSSLALLVFLSPFSRLSAADRTWTGAGSNLWNSPGNWSALPVAGDILTFGPATGIGGTTLNNDFTANTNFNGLVFAVGAPAYTLAGNAINITGANSQITNRSTFAQTINLSSLTFTGNPPVVSGFQAITLGGTAVINNQLVTNNLSGGRVLTLSGPVYLSNDATTGRAASFGGSGATKITGVISDSTTGTPANNVIVSNMTGSVELAAANTYSGLTKLTNSGTLTLSNSSAIQNSRLQIDSAINIPGPVIRLLSDTGATFATTGTNLLNGAGLFNIQVDALASGSGNTLTLANLSSNGAATVNLRSANNYTLGVTSWTMTNAANLAPISGKFAIGTITNANIGISLSGSTVGNTIGSANLGTGGLTKIGSSTWTLTGASNYSGVTLLNAGTLGLDISAGGSLNTATSLNLGGGKFVLKGASSGTSSQTVAGLQSNTGRGGASSVTIDANTGSGTALVITSGTIFRTLGSTIDFVLPGGTQSATNGFVTTQGLQDGLLGGNTNMPYATVNGGTDYATNAGNNIVAYTGYTNITALGSTIANAAASNVRINSAGTSGNISLAVATTNINTLFQNSTSAATVDLAGGTLNLDGILLSPGAAALTIGVPGSAGTLGKPNGADFVFINNSSSALTVNSVIAGGAVALTKSGTGTLVLANTANTFTGRTYLNGGITQIAADASLGTAPASFTVNQLIINGGTLQWGGSFDLAATRGLTIGENGATLDTNGFNTTIATAIATGSADALSLTKTGLGTLTLSASNTFLGTATVNSGTLAYGVNDVFANANDVVVTGSSSVLDLGASHTDTVGLVTVANGGSISGSGSSTLTSTKGFEMKSGSAAVALAGTTSINLSKTTSGTATLTGANSYAGKTLVQAGTLLINGTHTGSGDYLVSAGAVLGGSGSIALATATAPSVAPSVSVGGTLAPGGINPGTLDIGGNLVLQNGSTLALQLGGLTPGDGAGLYSQVNMTSATGVISMEDNVTLSLSLAGSFGHSSSDVFYIVNRSDSAFYSTLFSGTTEGGLINLTGGYTAQITYLANWTGSQGGSSLTGGNDIAIYNLSSVPEPSTYAMFLGGLVFLFVLRRKKGSLTA